MHTSVVKALCVTLLRAMASKSQHFRGVRQRQWGSWVSEIRHPITKIRVWLGSFQCAEEAALAYDEAARLISGPNANTNFPFNNTISNTANFSNTIIHHHHHHHHSLSLASKARLRRSCYSPAKQFTDHYLSSHFLLSNTNIVSQDLRCSTALRSSYSKMIDASRYATFSSWNDLCKTDYNNPKEDIELPQQMDSHDELATHFSINETTLSSEEDQLVEKESAICTANMSEMDACFVTEMINELLTSNSSFDLDFCFLDLP